MVDTPIEPYEKLGNHGALGEYVFRPLLYAFQHKVLPWAFFTQHPELVRALQAQNLEDVLPTPSAGNALM
jgi:hypothetical protein